MKVASFNHQNRDSYGVVNDDGIVDVGRELGAKYAGLRQVLEAGALGEVAAAAAGKAADVAFDDVTHLPVIGDPAKIICVGLNYDDHRKEGGAQEVDNPTLFTRFANSQVGHGQPIIAPKVSDHVDYEAELAVIIGRRGRHISEDEALDYVAGYACYNDVSMRDWQRHTTQFTPGKNFVGSGPFGPWMVTADEIPDPQKLAISCRLNGQEMQKANTDLMIFPIVTLINYISRFTELEPGDVISTGTPSGVGFARKPPVWMKAGDVVEIDIEGVGVLSNPVVDE